MLIKQADDKSGDIATLKSLLSHPAATADHKKRIDQEIRNISSGAKGEQDAAYEMNFYFGPSNNWAIIHDLRLEHKGRVAQIDHILVSRFLDIWVCESKRFSEGIAINEQGECSTFWQSKPQGIASPHEQNTKHIAVVKAVCDDGVIDLPKRLGFSIAPRLTGLVVVSKNARIARPKTKGWWVDGIVKADQVKAKIDKAIDADNNVLGIAKIIGSDTLKAFANHLAALHVPASIDWYARFGLPKETVASVKSQQSPAAVVARAPTLETEAPTEDTAKKSKLACIACGETVTYSVAKFCWVNKPRFGGNVYCIDCQRNISKPSC